MPVHPFKLALAVCCLAGNAVAECAGASFALTPPTFDLAAPLPPDPSARPVRPACLGEIGAPQEENCPRDVLAEYAKDLDTWVAALNAFVSETNDFANAAVRHANSTIDFAEGAREFADAAFGFADCEVAEINKTIDE